MGKSILSSFLIVCFRLVYKIAEDVFHDHARACNAVFVLLPYV